MRNRLNRCLYLTILRKWPELDNVAVRLKTGDNFRYHMATEPQKVSLLPLPRARATAIVREVVEAGRWSLITQGLPQGKNSRQVFLREIENVLKDGQMIEDSAEADEHDCFRFSMVRVCAGASVTVDVALEGAKALPNLYVLRATGLGIE